MSVSRLRKTTKTASIYIRLSKDADAENLSKEGMIRDCEGVAARHGLTVIAVHVDDGISGAVRNRPAFLAWLADGREGRADTLIAWHADRMTREGVNVAAMILDVVEGKDTTTGKVTFPPVRLLDTKGLDSESDETAFRFRFVIAAEVARGERARMSDRSKSSKRRLMSSGRWRGGVTPYGFRSIDNPDGAGKVLEIHPDEATFIREATARVLAGETFMSVLRWANGPDGSPPRMAKTWGRRALIQVLTGYPAEGKVVARVNGSRTDTVPVLDERGEPVTIPAILTADESAAVRRVLTEKRDDRKRGGRQPSRVLSGLIHCHDCGLPLWVARPSDAVPVYRCQDGKARGICAAPVSVRCTIAEDIVVGSFLARHGDRPAHTRQASVSGAANVASAEAAVAAALQELAHAATPEAFTALQEAQAARETALSIPQETETRLVPTGRTVREEWETLDVQDRRAVLAENVSAVILLPNPGGRGGRGRPSLPNRFIIIDAPSFPASEPAEGWTPRRLVAGEPS